MSLLADYLQTTVNDFRGAWLLIEPSDVPITNALLAQNVEYLPGLVKTRFGYSSVMNTGDQINSMFSWISPTFTGLTSYLAFLSAAGPNLGINLIKTDGTGLNHLYVPAGIPVGASFATGGYRLFIATFNSIGQGTDQGRVYSSPTIFNNGGTDTLFLPPLGYIPVVGNGGAGSVTAGVHQIGYLLTTRNGFTTSPSPVSGATFTAVSHTSPGATTMTVSITPTGTWPESYITAQIIMTIAGGTQFYIVPSAAGGSAGIAYGTNFPTTFTIDIDDGTLAADGVDATPFFDILTQLNITLRPSVILNYSSRMVYIALDSYGQSAAFISEINDWQHLTADQNVIYLPGNLQIITAFVLYNTLYLVGPHWTYSVQDNGGVPVTWASPQLIDNSIGTLAPLGVTVNAAQGIAWICDTDGLYLFSGGAYGTLPISYYQQPDWRRGQWGSVAATVQVIDNRDHKRVQAIVPLDAGTTTPNYILSWDYSRGLDPQSVNYSLDFFTDYNPSSIVVIPGPTSGILEDWIGPGDTLHPIMQRNHGTEPNPYRDNGQVIQSAFQTAYLPPLDAVVWRHSGDKFRLSGQGTTYITARGLDGSDAVTLNVVPETTYAAKLYLRRYDLLSEVATLTFVTHDLDAWFQLSQLTHYYSLFVIQR